MSFTTSVSFQVLQGRNAAHSLLQDELVARAVLAPDPHVLGHLRGIEHPGSSRRSLHKFRLSVFLIPNSPVAILSEQFFNVLGPF